MDSTAYKHLAADIINNKDIKISDQLPVLFFSENIIPDKKAFESVACFLEHCILYPQLQKQKTSISIPSILTGSDANFFSLLFKTAHEKLFELFSEKTEQWDNPLFKRNGVELLRFICHAASSKSIPMFPEGDIVNLALCLFLIEAFMNAGWCPNSFEDSAKRTAHAYFAELKKSLYKADNADLSTILGYVQSAWICAQKTEGIKDTIPEWESKNYTSHYSWELRNKDNSTEKINCTMYRYPENQLFFIIPRCNTRIPHPFANPGNEHKTGLILYSGNELLTPQKIVDYKPIQRHKFKGEQITYSCTLEKQQILWFVVLQAFESTIYRIDLLKPASGISTISNAELRIENSLPVFKTEENSYLGKGPVNIAIEFVKNPCCFEYHKQEAEDISLFKGNGAVFSPENPLELITAWSFGKNITCIDKTNPLEIFGLEL